MTREIKFRAWDAQRKEMFIPKKLEWDSKGQLRFWNRFSQWDGDMVLMQFTGLFDKNGKEIFEGDICKTYTETGGISERKTGYQIGAVKYFKNRFCIAPSKYEGSINKVFGKGKIYGFLVDEFTNLANTEVIGSIYENPELLEGV